MYPTPQFELFPRAVRYTRELSAISTGIQLAIKNIFQLSTQGLSVQIKSDGSPVTNADLTTDEILRETLLGTFQEDGWLSEECLDSPDRLRHSRVWILDPIDGTRPFIRSLPQFTISLALVEHGRLVLGVIVNPATHEYLAGIQGMGAYLNGKPLPHFAKGTSCSSQSHTNRPTFLVSPASLPPRTRTHWNTRAHCPMILGSIAYSLALVASGQVQGVINLGRQNEWDIAAGTLLIQETGGVVLDGHQRPIQFNQPSPVVEGIIATHPPSFPVMKSLLDTLT